MKNIFTLMLALVLLSFTAEAQRTTYSDSWNKAGYTLTSQDNQGVSVSFSVDEFTLTDITVRGENMKKVTIPGSMLPNDEGAPDVPGTSRFIAVPEGAEAILNIKSIRKETYTNVNVAPAPRIPFETEDGDLEYNRNDKIYASNSFYPAEPIRLSEKMQIRGVDVVILGITPFQYNPVTKELVVLRDIEVEVEFAGGNGQFGEERLRSRWWDPILNDALINHASLPQIDYSKKHSGTRDNGCEYLIIVPDNPVYLSWADTIKSFRNMQGISTMIVTISDIGANTTAAIENYVNEIYNTWDPVPAAILLMADYGSGDNGIMSPIWDNYCASDHLYADVDGDDIEEFVFARMTAQNETHLETMVRKAIDYETSPPTSPGFYDHPITALGYQTERWFQVCSESVAGYFENVQGKNPVRVNAIYSGDPMTGPWTSTDESLIVGIFGPSGLGYIPATPADVNCTWYGNSTDVTNALNDGAFMLQHRDHGFEYGWGEPDYDNDNIDDLTNTDLSFIFSVNCLTGKYNMSGECFTEKFHRHTYNGQPAGALGLIAASEVSYSFVNDTYVWGMYDHMMPDFLPDYGTTPESRGMLPAFGNTAGKFFLMQSNWPFNTNNKEVTYNLFHHHGDAFTRLYTEVPQALTVAHDDVLLAGLSFFSVQADEGSFIALSVDGTIIGTADGTGAPVNIVIDPQYPPAVVDIVVTKQNYYRYHETIQVIPPDGAYIVNNAYAINDENGNNNGVLDYGETVMLSLTLKNVGSENAENVSATISSTDEFVTILNNTAVFGGIPSNQTATVADQFEFSAAGNIPNGHKITFDIAATDGDTVWNSIAVVEAHAPILEYQSFTLSDAGGNNNGRLDPGETADILVSLKNIGSSDAFDVVGTLLTEDPFVTVENGTASYGTVSQNVTVEQTFTVSASEITPPGHTSAFELLFSGLHDIQAEGAFETSVGQFPVLILDLDRNNNSCSAMVDALDQLGVGAQYSTAFDTDVANFNVVFVSLGTYSLNHVLTTEEANELKAYLENGGNLYMEGGDTWYYDQIYDPTDLHPMFNIQGLDDGGSDLYLIKGTEGTFLEGMNYIFMGDNNYIDRIQPIAPAYSIFYNNSPMYDCVVAHDQGTYKTIGSNFEFGGLGDNTLNTKKKLMLKYLEFFGLNPITTVPETPTGPDNFCGGGQSGQYSTATIPEVDYYIWSIDPPEAGTVTGHTEEITIDWNEAYSGMAQVCVCGMNQAGMGPLSEPLEVMVNELPTATYSLTTNQICQGDSAGLVMQLTGTSPWSVILNINGGNYQFDFDKPNVPMIWFDPMESISIHVASITDGNQCENGGFDPVNLEVLPIPAKPVISSGPAQVDILAATSSTYGTSGVPGTSQYIWILDPASAGTMTPSGNEVDIMWANGFTGNVTLGVYGTNDCGDGTMSNLMAINVYSSLGIDEGLSSKVNIYPNPGEGHFIVEITSELKATWNISVVNTLGVTVWQKEEIEVSGTHLQPVDLTGYAEGAYLLILKSDDRVINKKIIIRK